MGTTSDDKTDQMRPLDKKPHPNKTPRGKSSSIAVIYKRKEGPTSYNIHNTPSCRPTNQPIIQKRKEKILQNNLISEDRDEILTGQSKYFEILWLKILNIINGSKLFPWPEVRTGSVHKCAMTNYSRCNRYICKEFGYCHGSMIGLNLSYILGLENSTYYN